MFVPLARGDLRDSVVRRLAVGPTTLKELSKGLPGYTYQGVHKTVGVLLKDEVVRKAGKAYVLDDSWVGELKSFADSLQSSGKSSALWRQELETKRLLSLSFDNMMGLGKFVLDFMYDYYRTAKEPYIGVTQFRHCWPAIVFVGKDYEKLKNSLSMPCFMLVNGNSFVDRFLAKSYTDMGVEVRCGIECAAECDLWVEQDRIFRVYFPTSLKRSMHDFYEKKLSGGLLNIGNYYELLHLSRPIHVSVTKDEAVARQIVDETLERFGTTYDRVMKSTSG